MNILLLNYIMNVCFVRLRYHNIYIYIYTYTYTYKMIFNNTLNFKIQLITYI